ncbi:hypothetical protein AHAS_Ahas19G0230100 [Arachis hypogaea]
MARTKTTPRYPSSSKTMAPPSGQSRPSTSKGKGPAAEEPAPEPSRPKPRSVAQRPQRGNPRIRLKSVRKPSIVLFEHKSQFITSHSNYNRHRFRSAMNHDFYEGVVIHCPICPTFLADLPTLKKKGD